MQRLRLQYLVQVYNKANHILEMEPYEKLTSLQCVVSPVEC